MPTRLLRKILVVEDDLDIQEVVDFALVEVGGFDVLSCGLGGEALARAPEFRPDMILLDVMMPEMDGPETLAGLRGLPETAVTPVVFITAKVQPREIEHYRSLGVADVISKPFDPMTLPGVLDDIWGRLPGNA